LKDKDKQNETDLNAYGSDTIKTVCSDLPNAFWHRKKHIVALPYIKDFSEKKISYQS
jgi:hypothetical protein